MLLGLVRPTSGTARVMGHPITHPREYLHRIGALIEGPAFYPGLSARANLQVLATLGGFPHSRIPGLLEQVGLADRARDRVGGYSLGMKQRLGVAAALLPEPELLILDEPANGLDPPRDPRDAGVDAIPARRRRHHLCQQSPARRAGAGRRLAHRAQGRRRALRGTRRRRDRRTQRWVAVRPERDDQLEIVERIAQAKSYATTRSDGTVHVAFPPDFAAALNRSCMAAGVTLVELHSVKATLEESFLTMIEGGA